jgi:hypothetical protein
MAGDAVTAGSHRERQARCSGEADRGSDVIRPLRPRDEGRPTIERGILDQARGLVVRLVGPDQPTTEAPLELSPWTRPARPEGDGYRTGTGSATARAS